MGSKNRGSSVAMQHPQAEHMSLVGGPDTRVNALHGDREAPHVAQFWAPDPGVPRPSDQMFLATVIIARLALAPRGCIRQCLPRIRGVDAIGRTRRRSAIFSVICNTPVPVTLQIV
jgi:hypothetical protein